MHVGVAWQRVLRAVDYGNAPIDQLSVERSMAPVRELVREIASTGAIPIVIGGTIHWNILTLRAWPMCTVKRMSE